MGHITNPALLLLELGIKGAAALQLHHQPAIPSRHHHGV